MEYAECDCCAGTPLAQVAAIITTADALRLREAGFATARDGWIVPMMSELVLAVPLPTKFGELPDWRVCDGQVPANLADIRVRILSTSAPEVEIGIGELEAFIASLPE